MSPSTIFTSCRVCSSVPGREVRHGGKALDPVQLRLGVCLADDIVPAAQEEVHEGDHSNAGDEEVLEGLQWRMRERGEQEGEAWGRRRQEDRVQEVIRMVQSGNNRAFRKSRFNQETESQPARDLRSLASAHVITHVISVPSPWCLLPKPRCRAAGP